MLNMLIIDDNMNYIKNLISIILKKEENIRLVDIALNGREALKILSNNKVDIILLDLKMSEMNGIQFLEYVGKNYRNIYEKSIIVITGDTELLKYIIENPLVYSYEIKPSNSENILRKIKMLEKEKMLFKRNDKLETKIERELDFLGYNLSHIGTKYLRECIKIDCIRYNKEAENISKQIYPIIAKKYQKTNFSIKNNIIKATNYMYNECEINKMKKYFHFEIDRKPTPKMVIKIIGGKI